MTSPGKPGFVLPVAVTLAVLLGLYAGAYYGIVRAVDVTIAGPGANPDGSFDVRYVKLPDYGDDGQSRSFFAPIHWLDRRIRPHFWE